MHVRTTQAIRGAQRDGKCRGRNQACEVHLVVGNEGAKIEKVGNDRNSDEEAIRLENHVKVPVELEEERIRVTEGADSAETQAVRGVGDEGAARERNSGPGDVSDVGNYGYIDDGNGTDGETKFESEVVNRERANNDGVVVDIVNRRCGSNAGQSGLIQDGEGMEDAQSGQGGDENDAEIADNQSSTLEEQVLENKRTWEVAVESGAMLYNEEDDIMAILKAQNEEIAQKKMAKQKAKARRCRPKNNKKVCNNFLK
ncbi:hypothetical protein AHAS_Ahas19G0091400 [Arachis hypogaea]